MPNCQMKTRKHANASQVEKGDGGDHHNAENFMLGRIGGSRGTKRSSEAVGIDQLRILLDSSFSLFFICLVHYWLNGEPFV